MARLTADRRRKTRTLKRRWPWLNRLGTLVACMTICLSCGWLGVRAAVPFRTAARWQASNDALEQDLHRFRIRNQRDEREIQALQTREGLEQAARRLGYVMPDEHPLRIRP